MDKKQCNIFDVVEGFDIIEATVEEREITDSQETRVVERVITIKAEKINRRDDKSKKLTLFGAFAICVTFVGLLADIPNAFDFVKNLLH